MRFINALESALGEEADKVYIEMYLEHMQMYQILKMT